LVSYSRADAQYRFDLTSGLQPNPGNAGASSPASVAIDYPTAVDGCALGSGVQVLPGASDTFLLFHGVDSVSGPQRMLAVLDVQDPQQASLLSQTTLQDGSTGFSIDVNQGRALSARTASSLGFLSLDYDGQL